MTEEERDMLDRQLIELEVQSYRLSLLIKKSLGQTDWHLEQLDAWVDFIRRTRNDIQYLNQTSA